MPIDLALLLLAVATGAMVQAGVGIGFSIIVAPVMMVMLGTAVAVPVLLLLNLLISFFATDLAIWRQDKVLIQRSIIGCLIGICIGLMTYPYLTEPMVLSVTAILLLIGVISTLFPFGGTIGQTGTRTASGLSGLATIWTATPGPLMVLGFLAVGRSPQDARKLVQPVALVAYGTAFTLHNMVGWTVFASAPWLLECATATILGSLIGRWIGPKLPQQVIGQAIRWISILACMILFYRAYTMGGE